MNRDQVQGCGCLAGLLAALAALGVGGLFAIAALFGVLAATPIGWAGAAAIMVAAVLAFAGTVVGVLYLGVKAIVAARQRSRTTGPYRTKLNEIDRLMKDVEAAIFRVAGSDFGAQELNSKLRELRKRRDDVLTALVEIDEFLRAPENKDYRLRTESTYLRVRERLAGESVKPELSENAARLKDVQNAVARVKGERQALIANLDRIAIGLREIRARMLPTSAALASGEEIGRDLSKLTDAIHTEEKIKRELDALEKPEPEPDPGPGARAQKLPH